MKVYIVYFYEHAVNTEAGRWAFSSLEKAKEYGANLLGLPYPNWFVNTDGALWADDRLDNLIEIKELEVQ